jgi:DNA-binding NtrC family response regulator
VTEDTLRRVQNGILFIDDLSALSRVQSRGLAFICARADRAGVRVVAFSRENPSRLDLNGLEAGAVARLADLIVPLPPLRDHAEDIPELAVAMLARLCEARVVPARRLATGALNIFVDPFPRNLEQLEQVIRSAAVAASAKRSVLPRWRISWSRCRTPSHQRPSASISRCVRHAISSSAPISSTGSRASRVPSARLAERSGMERTHLYRKLRQLGIQPGRREDEPEA